MDFAITGIGIYNGLGFDRESNWQALLDGKSAIKELNKKQYNGTLPSTFDSIKIKISAQCPAPTDDQMPDILAEHWSYLDAYTKCHLITVDEAWKDCGLQSKNVGIINNTIAGAIDTKLECIGAVDRGVKRYSPRKLFPYSTEFSCSEISMLYGFNGESFALDSACSSGISAMQIGMNAMKLDPELDAYVISGAELTSDVFTLYMFQNLGALTLSGDLTASCPFDERRSGFVMGEGFVTIVIEPLEKAFKRGANIYSIIRGLATLVLCESITSPDMAGNGATGVINKALKAARLDPEKIDYINAHGTSTPVGDQIEYDVMSKFFPGRVMVSNKGQIGHTMGGSALNEIVYTALALRDQKTPGIPTLRNPIGKNLVIPTASMSHSMRYAVKTSFGFGGRNGCVILERA